MNTSQSYHIGQSRMEGNRPSGCTWGSKIAFSTYYITDSGVLHRILDDLTDHRRKNVEEIQMELHRNRQKTWPQKPFSLFMFLKKEPPGDGFSFFI